MSYQLERLEDQLHDDYEKGRITRQEFEEELRQLHRDYREAAREAAHEAYERELDRW